MSPQVHGSRSRAFVSLTSNRSPQLSPCPEHADILKEIVTLCYLKTYSGHERIGVKAGSLAGVGNGDSGSQAKGHLVNGIGTRLGNSMALYIRVVPPRDLVDAEMDVVGSQFQSVLSLPHEVGGIPGCEYPVHGVAAQIGSRYTPTLSVGDVYRKHRKCIAIYEHDVVLGQVYAVEHSGKILVRIAGNPVFAYVTLSIGVIWVDTKISRVVPYQVVGSSPEVGFHPSLG